ncbi:glycoside hydrolase [Achlya hypogyna]|uniref:Glycoside hydrolase n=1 Tax=Achlya hypogyna TaxID=1202772 RepID=A0A1V9Z8L2_ACHHY|nr:glycoside hydrolase [Achlya hypogyna]
MRGLLLTCLLVAAAALEPIVIKGQRMFGAVSGSPFVVQGVDYYPRPNAGINDKNSVDFFTDDQAATWGPHIAAFQALNVNVVRLYAVDPTKSHDKFMCALSAAGIYVMIELASSCPGCEITSEPYPTCYPASLKTRGQQIIAAFSKYSNVLGFSGGNEVNHRVKDPATNAPCQKKFIRDMRAFAQSCSKSMRQVPIGIAVADSERSANALYYNCRTDAADELENVEWYGLNVYLQCDPKATTAVEGPGFVELKKHLTAYKMTVPVVLTEFGCLNEAFPTVDGYAAQRTWVQVPWLVKDPDLVAGGVAFEFSTENANSMADAPYPFKSFGKQNYGLGYFTPATCDHASVPCVFNKMPNFKLLAAQYAQLPIATKGFTFKDKYTAFRTVVPACPAQFAALKSIKWAPDAAPNLQCPNYTKVAVCPGDLSFLNGQLDNDTTVTIAPILPQTTAPNAPTMPGGATATTKPASSTATTNVVSAAIVLALFAHT